jgi:hypothetical protein
VEELLLSYYFSVMAQETLRLASGVPYVLQHKCPCCSLAGSSKSILILLLKIDSEIHGFFLIWLLIGSK